MSEKQYGCAAGFVQFDPKSRDTSAGQVRDMTIRAFGSQKNVSINLFASQWGNVVVAKGDLVAADGPFTKNVVQKDDGSAQEYVNLTPYYLSVNGVKQVPIPRETVNTTTTAPAASGASTESAPF